MMRSLVAALLLPAALATNSSINATNATRAPAALCCALEMADSYGDGWDGVTIEIATNASALIASGLTVETDAASFEGACFGRDDGPFAVSLVDLSLTSWPSEISWQLCGGAFSAGASTPRYVFDWAALVAAWAADGYSLVGGALIPLSPPSLMGVPMPSTSPPPPLASVA